MAKRELIMNINNLGKTLLCAYRHLEAITNAYEKLIKKIALNSIYSSISGPNNTFSVTNKMLDLLDKKEKYLNLKVICEKTILNLNDEDKKILCLIYFDNVNYTMCAKLLNISVRTFFRRKQTAIANFCFQLEKLGYDEKYFLKNYFDDQIFIEYYNLVESSGKKKLKENQVDALEDKLVFKMINRIEKSYTLKKAYGY